jgi:hypothetical protein
VTTERYVEELIALAKSDKPLSEALDHFTLIFDAYMVETPGSFVQKRRVLLEAFREKAPDTPLTWPIIDNLGWTPRRKADSGIGRSRARIGRSRGRTRVRCLPASVSQAMTVGRIDPSVWGHTNAAFGTSPSHYGSGMEWAASCAVLVVYNQTFRPRQRFALPQTPHCSAERPIENERCLEKALRRTTCLICTTNVPCGMELKVVANLRKTSSDSTIFGRGNAPE